MNFNIIFIQEPLQSIICSIPSSSLEEGEIIVGVPYHPLWITFSRQSANNNDHPRVITYISIRYSQLCFSLRKDIFNHGDINLILFFNQDIICFIINIYSDDQQLALKYLKDIEVNLNNVLIMTVDFNIKDNDWDPLYFHYSLHTNILKKITDLFNLKLSTLINQFSIQYTDNPNNSNLDIDLIFL